MSTPEKKIEREIIKFLSKSISQFFINMDTKDLISIEEIRIRANRPIMVINNQGDWFFDSNNNLTKKLNNSYIINQSDIINTLLLMSENSIYAYQDEIKNGFLTIKGGHRVGIVGKVVMENNLIKTIKDISGLNIRVSREIIGSSNKIIKHLINSKNEVCNTLIISPPMCGKTTILRDIARVLSEGIKELDFKGQKVLIIDERSEIAACFKGVPQNQVGVRTDVLDSCPKSIGMQMVLRSMSPQIIITDEIGNKGDKDAILSLLNGGVKIITTVHGYNVSELKMRYEILSLIQEKVFEKFVVLSNREGSGTIEEIADGTLFNDTLFNGK